MIGGEVVEELTAIDFERGRIPLRALLLGLSRISKDTTRSYARVSRPSEEPTSALSSSCTWVPLQASDHNRIASDGCFYISKTNLPKLTTLDLESNEINDNGAGHLSNSSLPNLINFIISTLELSKTTTGSLGSGYPRYHRPTGLPSPSSRPGTTTSHRTRRWKP